MTTPPTETLHEALSAGDTEEIAFRIAAILAVRRLSDDEQQVLREWVRYAHAGDTLATAIDCDFQLRHAPVHLQESLRDAPDQRRSWNHLTVRLVALAASVVLLATYVLLQINLLGRGTTYQTGTGERMTATLDDGSSVTLNTASAIRWLGKGCARQVVLERGEVLFDVHSDPHCPFTVLLDTGVSISVLGTRFDAYRYTSGQILVTVLEGSVQINSAHWAQVIKPEQSASVKDRNLTITEHANTEQRTAWLKDQVTFNNLPLSEAIQELQRYSKRPIRIADPQLTTLRITGVFSTQDIKGTLSRLALVPSVDDQHPAIRLEQLPNGTLVLHAAPRGSVPEPRP